ncbi:hypothetical protein CCACVL1_09289, partial [Corchorus capsularis]
MVHRACPLCKKPEVPDPRAA